MRDKVSVLMPLVKWFRELCGPAANSLSGPQFPHLPNEGPGSTSSDLWWHSTSACAVDKKGRGGGHVTRKPVADVFQAREDS